MSRLILPYTAMTRALLKINGFLKVFITVLLIITYVPGSATYFPGLLN